MLLYCLSVLFQRLVDALFFFVLVLVLVSLGLTCIYLRTPTVLNQLWRLSLVEHGLLGELWTLFSCYCVEEELQLSSYRIVFDTVIRRGVLF